MGSLRVVIACLSTIVIGAIAPAAGATDISIFSAGAVKVVLSEAAESYGKANGDRIAVEYMPVGALLAKLAEGARPDAVILSAETMAEAEAKGWAASGGATPLGVVGVGVAVRADAPLPDISTPEALKQALLAAKSIVYIDPARGTSGKHFAAVLDKLGIAEAVRGKTTLGSGGYVVEPVAHGEVELGIQQITEILPVKGVRLVGPLPDALQKFTVYSISPTTAVRDPAAVRAFIQYLTGTEMRARFVAAGFSAP